MAFSSTALNTILNSIKGSFATIYLSAAGASLIGQDVTGLTTIDGAKTLSWGTATNGTWVKTTNSATSNPINFSVPQSTVPTRLLLVNASNIVTGSSPLQGTVPSYASGDGPYFVREFTLNIAEGV